MEFNEENLINVLQDENDEFIWCATRERPLIP